MNKVFFSLSLFLLLPLKIFHCVYLYAYMCVCTCIYVLWIYMHVCTHVSMYVCVCVNIYACVCVSMYVCMCTCVCACAGRRASCGSQSLLSPELQWVESRWSGLTSRTFSHWITEPPHEPCYCRWQPGLQTPNPSPPPSLPNPSPPPSFSSQHHRHHLDILYLLMDMGVKWPTSSQCLSYLWLDSHQNWGELTWTPLT